VFEQVAAAPAVVAPTAVAPARTGHAEIDLNVALDEMNRQSPQPQAAVQTAAPIPPAQVWRRGSGDDDYQQGMALYGDGRIDEAVPLLEAASTAPGLRFAASSILARIFRDRGAVKQAIEWFERAAQAPAPTADEGHVLLFDLAEALESEGETSRALAICMELQADAGNYRDVAARIDRLAKARARG
jgi:tetratricopeptide (TPR) repeat protein